MAKHDQPGCPCGRFIACMPAECPRRGVGGSSLSSPNAIAGGSGGSAGGSVHPLGFSCGIISGGGGGGGGRISPAERLKEENQRLRAHFDAVVRREFPDYPPEQIAADIERIATGEAPNWHAKPAWRDIKTGSVDWVDIGTANCLHKAREIYPTLGALADAPEHEIRRVPNLGPARLDIILEMLRRAMAGEDVTLPRRRTLGDMARSGRNEI